MIEKNVTMQPQGTLYLVATPIGNLDDITYRAINILRKVHLIAAEDTRHSLVLLQHYGIKKPLVSLHDVNEAKRIPLLLERLNNGEDIALISDAGTPLISDPGGLLVKKIRADNINVVPIPGPCAAIAALCASGLPTDHFVFEGFLSTKTAKRTERLKRLCADQRTSIIYEAPHRILKLITELKVIFGSSRQIVLAKELTKTFECFVMGTADEIDAWLQADARRQKGEFVVLIKGVADDQPEITVSQQTNHILQILLAELSLKQAVAMTAEITGVKKNLIYKAAIEKQESYQ